MPLKPSWTLRYPPTHMHTLRSPSPFQIQGTQHIELVHSGAQTFPRTGTRGFALRSSRFLGGQRTIPLPCTGTCDRSRRCKTSAPSPRTPFQRGARSASFRVGCSLFSVGWGPVVSGSGAHEALVWAPAGWMAPRSGREAALGPEVRPLLSAWGRGSGEDSSATHAPPRAARRSGAGERGGLKTFWCKLRSFGKRWS